MFVITVAVFEKNVILYQLIKYLPTILITTLLLLFLYKILTFKDYVLHVPSEIPASVRFLPDQKFPPDYPNGWIPIIESQRLRADCLETEIHCLGTSLTVKRRKRSIEENEDQLGAVEVVETETGLLWKSVEVNGAIFVWHHAEKESQQEPEWTLTPIEEILTKNKNPKWVYRGRTEHQLQCHVQEIPENGADIAHLNAIHVDSILLGSRLETLHFLGPIFRYFLSYSWTARWSPSNEPDTAHISNIELSNEIKLFKRKLFGLTFTVQQVGPTYVELRFKSETLLGYISGVFLQFVTPLGPLKTSIVHHLYTNSSFLAFIFSKFALYGEAKMLERDIQIWNRKAFLSKPHFAKSERSLVQYRRWYSQFYSQNSKRSTIEQFIN